MYLATRPVLGTRGAESIKRGHGIKRGPVAQLLLDGRQSAVRLAKVHTSSIPGYPRLLGVLPATFVRSVPRTECLSHAEISQTCIASHVIRPRRRSDYKSRAGCWFTRPNRHRRPRTAGEHSAQRYAFGDGRLASSVTNPLQRRQAQRPSAARARSTILPISLP